jgi:hypothetical protein
MFVALAFLPPALRRLDRVQAITAGLIDNVTAVINYRELLQLPDFLAREIARTAFPLRAGAIMRPVSRSKAPLQNEVRRREIVVEASQYDRKVRRRISVHIGLNNRVAAALEPTHAVGNNVGILTSEEKSLVSFGRL